jgi:steroid 5-alpha reductase family enzyme
MSSADVDFSWAAAGILLAVAVGVVVITFTATLVVARVVGRHSIVDVTWGLGFVLIAVAAYVVSGALGVGNDLVRLVALLLPVVWGLRLAIYIGWRNHGKGEDPRYAAMLGDDHPPGATTAHVLRKVYLPQAGVMLVVVLPVLAAMVRTSTVPAVVIIGVVVWLVGFGFESVGDAQLARFKANPENKGKVLDSGLWRYTRHPNYFGDFCVWWGIFLVAVGHPAGLVTIVGPALMSYLLIGVTGKELTEKSMSNRPGYAEYVERTSGFFPLPPGSAPARAT